MRNNNERNERILHLVEEKIAVDKFEKSNLRKDIQKNNMGLHWVLKVASVVAVLGVISGNIYTYATYKKDMFSVILEKVGIFSEYQKDKKDVNITYNSNEFELTLTDYGIDEDTLIIGYNLKLKEKVENEIYFLDNSRLSDGEKIWEIDTKSNIESFNKISDTEYRLYKFYKIDTSSLSESVEFSTDIMLYERLDELNSEKLANWNFKIGLENDKLNLEHERYVVNNKETEVAKMLEVSKTKLSTKMTILLKQCSTEPSVRYYVEILDNDGNIILENKVERLFGGTPTDIIFSRINFDKKLTINIYETYVGYNDITKKETMILDLSKDLSKKNEENIQRESKTFRDLEFKYIKGSEIYETTYNEGMGDEEVYYFDVKLYNNIGDEKIVDNLIGIRCYKNLYNEDLETLTEHMNKLEYLGGYALAREYTIFASQENKIKEDIILDYEQMMDLADGKDVNVNGNLLSIKMIEGQIHDIKIEDKRKVKVDGKDAITWLETYGEECRREYVFLVNGYVYEISCPIDFDNISEAEMFVESIKINK